MTSQAAPEDLYATGRHLWKLWMEMWNGRPELARALVADGFTLHLTIPSLVRQETIVGPADVERWVTGHRARFRRLVFHPDCGPFVDVAAGVIAGPWFAELSVDESPRLACGMDMLAFVAGRITEYWTLAREVDEVGRWVSRAQ
jgi:hypothetical protein